MPYVEHTWTNGETITVAKMNNIEEGIAEAAQSGGSVLIVDSSNNTLNKTVQEIYNALLAGIPVYLRYIYGDVTNPNDDVVGQQWLAPIAEVYRYGDSTYRVVVIMSNGNYAQFKPQAMWFNASSMSGYATYGGSYNA